VAIKNKSIALLGFYSHFNAGDDLMADELPHVLFCGGKHRVNVFSDESGPGVSNGKTDTSYLSHDVIVIGGGGVVAKDLWAFGEHRMDDLIASGKKVAFVNVNIVPTDICKDNSAFVEDLKRLNAQWWVRDMKSVELLAQIGITASYVPDISMRVGVVPPYMPRGKKRLAVFLNHYAFSDFFDRGSSVDRNLLAFRNMRAIAEYLDWMTQWGWKPTFWPAQAHGEIDDRIVSACVYGMMKNKECATWVIDCPRWETLATEIARADLVLSMRYHSTTMAAACGTPLLDITFHPKNREFLAEAGLTDVSVDFNSVTQNRLIAATQIAEKEGFAENLRKFREDAQIGWARFDQEWETFLDC